MGNKLKAPSGIYDAATQQLKLMGANGGAAGQPAATQPPAQGQVIDGYRFKGGNPADKNSWEKV